MRRKRFEKLYEKFLNNTCTLEEERELFNYIREYGNVDMLSDLKRFNDDEYKLTEKESAEIWKNIESRIATSRVTVPTSKVKSIYKYSIASAAVVLIVGLFYTLSNIDKHEFSTSWIVNRKSEISKVSLKDGTVVYLKPGSKIAYQSDFLNERNVAVEGEVFFAVAHDQTRPFNVKLSNDINLQVLGTRFNVKTGNSIHDIVLTEGKISITNEEEEEILLPSDRILVASSAMSRSKVDTLNYNSWINNQIYFKDKSLSEVMNTMKSYYPNYSLTNNPSYSNLQFTGYLPTDNYELLKQILIETFKHENLLTNNSYE